MTHHLEALGWTLVHFCWQAAAIALVYRIADLACSRARSHVRYLLALGSLLSMVAVSVVTLAYQETRSESAPPPAVLANHAIQEDVSSVGLQLATLSLAAPSTGSASRTPFGPAGIMVWLDALWLVGVLSLAARTLGGWWMLRRLRRTALLPVPESVQRRFEQVCRRLGLKRPIGLYLSEKVAGPLTIGMFRSLVLLPVSAILSLSAEQLEVVLAHELAHVRRADYLWNMVQTVVETLFFFHPAVWWIGRNLRQQRELCCDDIALECCNDPVVYASALLRLEEERRTRLHLAMALDGHQSRFGLRQRIGRILGEAPSVQYRRELAPASLIGICAAVVLFLLPMPQVFASLHARQLLPLDSDRHAASVRAALVAPTFLVGPPEEGAVPVAAGTRPTLHGKRVAPARPAVIAAVSQNPDSSPSPNPESGTSPRIESGKKNLSKADAKGDYIDQMRAAGYDVDLDKYVAMKIQGVTAEYARTMAQAGFGKPTADELLAMKVQGVQPDYVNKLRAMGIEATSYQDLVKYRIFDVSPEFIAEMKSAGFGSIPSSKLVELRIHGITAEYAKSIKAQFPEAGVQDVVQMRIFHIDDAFIASAKRHGFSQLTIDKLVKLRISGILGEQEPQ